MKAISQVLIDMGWTERLDEIALRVAKNTPDHRNPEAFHEEKSELVREIRKLKTIGPQK